MKLMFRSLSALVLVSGFAAVASSAAKIDLKRVTPVPDGTPIPIQDFFRPRILLDPVERAAGQSESSAALNVADGRITAAAFAGSGR
jgi:hypothetical protein